MMLHLAIVSCIIFGCTYAKSPADDYISMTGTIMGKSDNDFKNNLTSCAEMDYPDLDDDPAVTGMLKCIMDAVNDLCPEGTCSAGARTSLIYIGNYMVEEKKECVDLDGDAEFDPSCHIRMKLKYASVYPDYFELIFWFFYDPEVTEIKCNEERSLQSQTSQRMKENLRTRVDLETPLQLLHKRRAMDVAKNFEAIMKSRDAGIFSNLKRKLRRFNTN